MTVGHQEALEAAHLLSGLGERATTAGSWVKGVDHLVVVAAHRCPGRLSKDRADPGKHQAYTIEAPILQLLEGTV